MGELNSLTGLVPSNFITDIPSGYATQNGFCQTQPGVKIKQSKIQPKNTHIDTWQKICHTQMTNCPFLFAKKGFLKKSAQDLYIFLADNFTTLM